MSKPRPRLLLVDGHSVAFRAFFGIRELTTSRGEPVNAVFGFTKTLLKLLREEDPDYAAVAFDTPAPTFRHERFPAYKGNRAETPEEFKPQIPRIKDVIRGFNIPVIERDGYEADDILITLAAQGVEAGMDVIIVTHDKDIMQAVGTHVWVLNPHGEFTLYDGAKVREKYGVRPDQIIDFLGLAGDSVDNIPGVPGIGAKTAATLLEEYETLEGVLHNVDKISGKKRKENLVAFADQARLSRELATIDAQVPLDVRPEDCVVGTLDRAALEPLFAALEFRTLARDVLGENGDPAGTAAAPTAAEGVQYTTVTTVAQLKGVARLLKKAGSFCVDLETTSKDPMRAEVVGLALSCRGGEAYYVPVGHVPPSDLTAAREDLNQLSWDEARSVLEPLLTDPAYGKVGQNIKYDLTVLAEAGVDVKGVAFDTMIASGLLDPGRLHHSLDALAEAHLGHTMIPISDLIGKGKNQISMAEVPIAQASTYACEDADITWQLYELLAPELVEQGLDELFRTVELPLVPVLTAMERHGICVDAQALNALHTKIEKQMVVLEREIYAAAGREFNIKSTQQLGVILFEELGLKFGRKTKTGYSTDSKVLEGLAAAHPLPGLVLEYRALAKLDSTYVQTLPDQVNPKTGRIHTSYNQTGAATGRLSSKDPNLQNIPIRTPLGREVRRAFVAQDADHVLLSADYSQIELRVLAHVTDDASLTAAFRDGVDIHAQTSSQIFGVALDAVTPDMRRKAKIANFGIIYGMGAGKLSADMGISRAEAKAFIEQYLTVYPGIRDYMNQVVEDARRDGFVKTILNRRRFLPDLTSKSPQLRTFAERAAINTPIQGSAADVIKVAMGHLAGVLADHPEWRMLLQVHDELVFELPAADVATATPLIRDTMAQAYPLRVPLVVDVGYGRSWLDAHL